MRIGARSGDHRLDDALRIVSTDSFNLQLRAIGVFPGRQVDQSQAREDLNDVVSLRRNRNRVFESLRHRHGALIVAPWVEQHARNRNIDLLDGSKYFGGRVAIAAGDEGNGHDWIPIARDPDLRDGFVEIG